MATSVHVTVPMFEKGRSFVMAGALVKAYEGHRFVYLHLLCQGLECIGKALLLAHDYEKYEPKLKSDFGHGLEYLIAEVDKSRGSAFFSQEAHRELKALDSYYKRHMLRYGDPSDFKKESAQLKADSLHRELVESLDSLNTKLVVTGDA
ncbi:hypothetical protein PL263_19365 [Methylomonas sp. EFPC3]|uniref:hypothetical protein n=1 Tax=Methylomonas sp. EFPC3 TaxID=3021710 RepID=UPI002417F245|nr:hypothetical protein [Methylomonas sp. EFPC3]WFP50238.1 hypothetical protein PL263_19365 [Methylomonas sp. EFPC3]